MTVQTLTVNVPERLYRCLKQRADQAHRSVEAEMLEVLATAAPVADELPADWAEVLASLSRLDDTVLWQEARRHLAVEVATQLEQLHLKRQQEGLTEAEAQALAELVRHYERAMLVRAQAAALLKQRGYDVRELAISR